MRISIERLVIVGLPEAPALDDFVGDLRRELTDAFTGASQTASQVVGEVQTELSRDEVSAQTIAAAVRTAVGGRV